MIQQVYRVLKSCQILSVYETELGAPAHAIRSSSVLQSQPSYTTMAQCIELPFTIEITDIAKNKFYKLEPFLKNS